MVHKYLITAWRNLKGHKLYTALNIIGLATAMACAVGIFLFIQYDWSFDRFHQDAHRIFRLVNTMELDIGDKRYSIIASYIGPMMKEEFPEVGDVVRLSNRTSYQDGILWKGETYRTNGLDADPHFLDFFDFPLLKGSPKEALNDPDSILLTESLARRIFGKDEPLGAILEKPEGTAFKVTGILKDVPQNSHMKFEFLTSTSALRMLGSDRSNFDLIHTYLKLKPGTSAAVLEEKIPDFLMRRVSEHAATHWHFFLQPLTSIHLKSHLFGELEENSDIRYTYYLSFLGILILFLACVNYMNLSGALALGRAGEVSIRKIVGAERRHILMHFLSESLLTAFISVVLAASLVSFFLPLFNSVARYDLQIDFGSNVSLYGALFGMALIVGFFSGSFPALLASAFQPVQILKGKLSLKTGRSGIRTALVVFQFAVSTAFIIGTLVIVRQMRFVRTKDLGFAKDQVIILQGVRQEGEILKEEVLRDPRIDKATLCSYTPGSDLDWPSVVVPEGAVETETSPKMPVIDIDADYFETFRMEIVEGRGFLKEMETSDAGAAVITAKAARELGWPSAIGRQIYVKRPDRTFTIVGVVKDIHFESLRRKIGSYIFTRGQGEDFYNLAVYTRSGDIRGVLDEVGKKWNALYPDKDFTYRFLDEEIDRLYEEEKKSLSVISFSSVLAIIISCLGLFGLASLAIEIRTKEIGIRKILGASHKALILMLSKKFLRDVLVANLIAWPAAYFFAGQWLSNFAYRISLHPWMFLAGGVATAMVAFLSVGYHAIKAASANPVDSLRYE
jgi:putative ABC transport system permease protein